MSRQALQFLSQLPVFADLPPEERERLAAEMRVIHAPRGAILATQGQSSLNYIYLIKSGSLELYYEKEGQKRQSAFLGRGSLFGGISILMNAGVSVRTARVDKDASFYVIARETFVDLCARHNSLYAYFADDFAKRMLDESYAGIVAAGQAVHFLGGIVPFSFLPPESLESLADALSLVYYPRDTLLFIQGQSRIDNLYIIHTGAAELLYEESGGQVLSGLLGEGELFGGISMLVNDGLALRSIRMREDTYFYLLPGKVFLETCRRNPAFSDFFTDTFGRRMLDRTYAEIVAKSRQPKPEQMQLFNQAVQAICSREPVFCEASLPIREAAAVMGRHRCSSILIGDAAQDFVGLVTAGDLQRRVIAEGLDVSRPVWEVMSSPLVTIGATALVFEALITMMGRQLKHLAVTDGSGRVVGMLTDRDILMSQGNSPLFLIQEIAAARSLDDVVDKHRQLPAMIKAQIDNGAKAENLTRLITTLSEGILTRLISLALERHGPPPVPFAFVILGSEGRSEQTLKTDQDNAIVHADVAPERQEEVGAYFLQLGETVCTWLDRSGYAFCEGGIMAKNPRWCRPLSAWKAYFSDWIHAAQPEDLLNTSIFFDFRGAFGDLSLVRALRHHLFDSLVGWAGFFRHMTENALHFKPPLGFFRNFVVESKGDNRNTFDIKRAMMPVVDFARIYALYHRIEETNTIERLRELYRRKVLKWTEFNDLEQAYAFMLHLRFVRQVSAKVRR